jgi:hypothetical protein
MRIRVSLSDDITANGVYACSVEVVEFQDHFGQRSGVPFRPIGVSVDEAPFALKSRPELLRLVERFKVDDDAPFDRAGCKYGTLPAFRAEHHL